MDDSRNRKMRNTKHFHGQRRVSLWNGVWHNICSWAQQFHSNLNVRLWIPGPRVLVQSKRLHGLLLNNKVGNDGVYLWASRFELGPITGNHLSLRKVCLSPSNIVWIEIHGDIVMNCRLAKAILLPRNNHHKMRTAITEVTKRKQPKRCMCQWECVVLGDSSRRAVRIKTIKPTAICVKHNSHLVISFIQPKYRLCSTV
jgi:hypothetical protein